jgi:hypothetical protein
MKATQAIWAYILSGAMIPLGWVVVGWHVPRIPGVKHSLAELCGGREAWRRRIEPASRLSGRGAQAVPNLYQSPADAGVAGSNPVTPTKEINRLRLFRLPRRAISLTAKDLTSEPC